MKKNLSQLLNRALVAKKKYFFLLAALMIAVSGMAQRHHDDHDHGRDYGRGHGGRARVECATHEQMQMSMNVLEQQPFDDKKLEIAKLCVTLGHFCVDDIARLASVFSFDENRLKFLIYAYNYCEDPQYYYSLRDVFTFQSNFDTLMDTVMPGYKRR